jgi:hypothetical protein
MNKREGEAGRQEGIGKTGCKKGSLLSRKSNRKLGIRKAGGMLLSRKADRWEVGR